MVRSFMCSPQDNSWNQILETVWPDFGDSHDQEGVDMFDKQYKGLGSAHKPQIKWKPDVDELRGEDFPV